MDFRAMLMKRKKPQKKVVVVREEHKVTYSIKLPLNKKNTRKYWIPWFKKMKNG